MIYVIKYKKNAFSDCKMDVSRLSLSQTTYCSSRDIELENIKMDFNESFGNHIGNRCFTNPNLNFADFM